MWQASLKKILAIEGEAGQRVNGALMPADETVRLA